MKIKKSVQKAMKKFHVDVLRKTQIKPINDILDHKDVLVVAPTSSGKSLIYQLPASMQKDKMTLVLEPTLALMHDQVRKLVNLGIPAAYLDSTMHKKEIENTLHAVRKGKIQILYVTPERLHTKAFREVIVRGSALAPQRGAAERCCAEPGPKEGSEAAGVGQAAAYPALPHAADPRVLWRRPRKAVRQMRLLSLDERALSLLYHKKVACRSKGGRKCNSGTRRRA